MTKKITLRTMEDANVKFSFTEKGEVLWNAREEADRAWKAAGEAIEQYEKEHDAEAPDELYDAEEAAKAAFYKAFDEFDEAVKAWIKENAESIEWVSMF